MTIAISAIGVILFWAFVHCGSSFVVAANEATKKGGKTWLFFLYLFEFVSLAIALAIYFK